MSKTITIVALVTDDQTGAIEDSNMTVVTGQSQDAVDAFKVAFKDFGDAQNAAAVNAGVSASHIKQHRHGGHHGKV